MLNNYVSDSSRDGRFASFLSANIQVTEASLDRSQMALKPFERLGRCSAFIACCILAFIFAMSSAARLSAQTAGAVSGHVADTTGAVIPGVAVTLTNTGTSATRSTITTGSGDYFFPDVPPGIYNISATHAGFKTDSSNNVEVQIQQSVRLDFSLQKRGRR